MADPDDDDDPRNIALEPEHRGRDTEDSALAAERRTSRAKTQRGERIAAVGLARDDEAERSGEEADLAHQALDDEAVEIAQADLELSEVVQRDDRMAADQTSEAVRLAQLDEADARHYRTRADVERSRAIDYSAERDEALDEAAAGRDEPGPETAAAAADGRRYGSVALGEDRAADRDYVEANRLDGDAQERRAEQPPAREAAVPPATTPRARRRPRTKLRKKPRERESQNDFGL